MRHSVVLPEILAMDPTRDHQRIGRLSAAVDFPWDTQRAYELALLKTFAVPSSSHLLAGTGEFLERTAKRHDDTVAVIATLGLEGYDGPRGREALRAMNRAHRGHAIPADEYRYTLSLFVLEPLRWNERFGWRSLSEVERQAGFHFWREVGRRMGIPDLPSSLSALEEESRAFERRAVRYDPVNRRLLDVTIDRVLARSLPGPLRRLGAEAVHALFDDATRAAFGLRTPPAALRAAVHGGLRARAAALRWLPARREPVGPPSLPTYPSGIDWNRVGPENRVGAENGERGELE